MDLQLIVIGLLSEGKFLHILHVGSDLIVNREVRLFNKSSLLLNTLVMELKADVLTNC